jgi:diguanylate cyclase (GGDEF)-like protein
MDLPVPSPAVHHNGAAAVSARSELASPAVANEGFAVSARSELASPAVANEGFAVSARSELASPAVANGVAAEVELVRLRTELALLRAERAELRWAIHHDELTGLANRRGFRAMAPEVLRERWPAVLIVLDLNGFKAVNDAYGHHVGDAVLGAVAHRLIGYAARHNGDHVAARFGGDEFAAVVAGPRDASGPRWWHPAVKLLCTAVGQPMPVAVRGPVRVTASVGVAPVPDDARLDELLHRADRAMYHAKAGGGGYAVWHPYADRPVRDHRAQVAA